MQILLIPGWAAHSYWKGAVGQLLHPSSSESRLLQIDFARPRAGHFFVRATAPGCPLGLPSAAKGATRR